MVDMALRCVNNAELQGRRSLNVDDKYFRFLGLCFSENFLGNHFNQQIGKADAC